MLNLSFFISKAADEAVDNLVPGEAGGDMAGPRGRCLRPPACIVDGLGHQRNEVFDPRPSCATSWSSSPRSWRFFASIRRANKSLTKSSVAPPAVQMTGSPHAAASRTGMPRERGY